MMHVEVDRRALMRGLKSASAAAERNASIPILSTLLLRADDLVELTGTDLDIERTAVVPVAGRVGEAGGEFLVENPRELLAVLKEASSKTCVLTTESVAERERIIWTAGELSTRGACVMHPDDFPRRHVVPHFLCATIGEDFAHAVRRLLPAISTEETRYYLNGIAIRHVGGKRYRLSATDGHRLHIADVTLADAGGPRWKGDVIIPRYVIASMLDVVAASPDGACMEFGISRSGNDATGLPDPAPKPDKPNAVRFGGVGDAVSCKLIDGTFPDVVKVVPAGVQTSLAISRAALRRAVAAANALRLKRSTPLPVRLFFTDGYLAVSAKTADGIEASCAVAAMSTAARIETAFNGNYLIAALDALGGDNVVLEWDAEANDDGLLTSPCKISTPDDGDFYTVLMPMRA